MASSWREDGLRTVKSIASEPAETLLAEFSVSGQQQVFEEIVRRYAGMVFSVCLRTCRDAHDAEDATQAVFLALAVQCKSGNAVRHLPAWLRQVAKRTSLDVRKSRRRREAREARRRAESSGVVNDDERPSTLDIGEIGHVLSEELAKLPAKYRLPLVSLYFGGLSREEIAGQLGLKPGALGVRLHRARAMLGDRLKRRGAIADGMVLSAGMAPLLEHAFGNALAIRTVDAAARVMLGHDLSGAVSANVLSLMHGTFGAVSLGKLKLIASVLLLLSTVTGGGVAVAQQADSVPQLMSHVYQWLGRVRFEFSLPQFDLRAAADAAAPAVPQPAYAVRSFEPRMASEFNFPADAALSPHYVPPAAPVASAGGGARSGGLQSSPQVQPTPSPTVVARAPTSLNRGPSVAVARSTVTQASRAHVGRADPTFGHAVRNAADGAGGPPAATVMSSVPLASLPGAGTGAVTRSNEPAPGSRLLAGATGPRSRGHVAGPTLAVGAAAGSSGTYTLDSGTLVTGMQHVGQHGQGTLVQTGGTNLTTQLLLGAGAGGNGAYHLRGGTLRLARGTGTAPAGLIVGGAGQGSLYLGDDRAAGHVVSDMPTFETRVSPAGTMGPFVVVRASATGKGTVRGWGRIDAAGGTFVNNGQVIADGYGRDRELALADFDTIDNTIENPASGGANGWFAQNGGALTMPALPHAGVPNRFTWGESRDDGELDLVNSVRLVIEPPPESVTISLLDAGRADLPALPGGHNFIGIWSIDTGSTLTERVDLSIRYDDGLAAERGLAESGLKLWRFTGGEWSLVTGPGFWRDAEANLIGGHTDTLDYFAVSAPEPGGLTALLAFAAAALLRRRRALR